MTPKEKAIEIVSKFEETIYGFDVFDDDWVKCMNCALIAVDEILNNEIGMLYYDSDIEYWQEVKQEIENL
jgi:hypothetical protein